MERTLPIRSSEEIDLYLRTIYSLLRSTNEVNIRTLEGVHASTDSSLHMQAQGDQPDTSCPDLYSPSFAFRNHPGKEGHFRTIIEQFHRIWLCQYRIVARGICQSPAQKMFL